MSNLIFIDLETTGLIPKKHEIIDICLVETNREGEVIREFYTKMKPSIQGDGGEDSTKKESI